MDLLVKNARLRGQAESVDIGVAQGKITRIAAHIGENADTVLDAGGHLLTPPFVESHVHLDATQSAGKVRENQSGTLLEAADIWNETKQVLTVEEIKKNALRTIRWQMAHGVQFIRTHVDIIDPSLKGLRAINELKHELRDIVDIQITAFPRTFAGQQRETLRLIDEALKIGIDGIGGSPQTEFTREEGNRALELLFALAQEHQLYVDIHTDETSDDQSRYVEQLIKLTFDYQRFGQVTASHTAALHNYDNEYALKVMRNLKRADINVVVNPTSNALLQNRLEGYPKRRGLTRVDELLEQGVNVSVGTDNIRDPFGPLGNGSLLHSVYLLAHLGHLSRLEDFPKLFDCITTNAAITLGKQDEYGVALGMPANFIVLDAEDEYGAIRTTADCLLSIHKGKVLLQRAPTAEGFTSWARSNLQLNQD